MAYDVAIFEAFQEQGKLAFRVILEAGNLHAVMHRDENKPAKHDWLNDWPIAGAIILEFYNKNVDVTAFEKGELRAVLDLELSKLENRWIKCQAISKIESGRLHS